MSNSRKFILAASALALASIFTVGTASAQGIVQVLDTVTVTGKDFALGLNEEDPPGFDELVAKDSASNFVDCESNTATGLICLDGDDVRIWPNLSNPTTSSVLLNCGNPALPFNTRRDNGCTAVARDAVGNIYLGGRLNGTANVVIRVFKDPSNDGTGCDASTPFTDTTDGTNYLCFDALASGRPRVEDIDVLEGDDKRLLVLEEKKTVLVYSNFEPDPGATQVDELANGKNDFNLAGNEQVLNAVLMEYVRPTNATERPEESDFFVIVATNRGRLIAVDTATSPDGVEVFDLKDNRIGSACAAEDDSFDITTSAKSNLAYATDRNDCSLHVLESVAAPNGDFDGFAAATGSPLSTSSLYPPLEVSVSPGIGFDLDDCFPNCNLIGDGAARLENVQVATAESGVTLFQIVGIPHCAWIPQTCYEILTGNLAVSREEALDYLIGEDVLRELVPADTDKRAQALVFNVSKLLPNEVTNRFQLQGEPPNGLPLLPPLLFPPEYRAQIRAERAFRFNALFFVPEPGVETDGVLTLEVNVSELTDGTELGCDLVGDLTSGYDLSTLLNWDVTVRASERWRSFDADYSPPGANFQGSTSNAGCGSTRSRTGGISIFPFDFEMTPCPVTLAASGTSWVSEGTCVVDGTYITPEEPDDAVFAKLYDKLYDELRDHLNELACTNTDSGAPNAAPLSPADCATLDQIWLNGKDKLVKAFDATIDPKTSAGAQNFGAVASQLQNYRAKLANSLQGGPDPANRIGEQEARLDTLEHVLVDKLGPSIPATGFVESDRTWAE